MEYLWKENSLEQEKIEKLYQELKIHPKLCRLLVARHIENYEQAKHFFRPRLEDLHSPFLMKNMDKAIKRIEEAIFKKERILFFGDYDVDGTTSVSLMVLFFQEFYPNIDFYVPDRNGEGYGISFKGIDYAAENKIPLIVALDCGIKAIDKVAYAKEKNIDFIICDHHTPGEALPEALAILNPKQKDCPYPYKELAGCGIGFKLCQGLAIKQGLDLEKLFAFLDLVCISIACDIVPISGENRILAYYGLQALNSKPSIGVKNIVAHLDLGKDFTIADVVFKIGPRINAAGRMAHANAAVEVLINRGEVATLQSKNLERQSLDKEITQSALQEIEKLGENSLVSTVVFDPTWHKGVVGIVASRLIESHYKPTVVLTESEGKLTGSARSVEGFNVYEALDACSDLMLNFGGHAYAAGLTIAKENLDEFKKRFDKEVAKRILPEQLIPKIKIDAELLLSDIRPAFFKILQQFAPFGPENMLPIFKTCNLKDTGYSKIVGENHLKLDLQDENGNRIKGIAFKMADKLTLLKQGSFDICYQIEENSWNGQVNLELNVKDIKAR
ncbi:MAG: single-stranded-DNA-specific exonuclease RecJ [Bacteroidetes bacterium]|nr:single-stranded-DNA-specific exonuclease RecJ [Bacteroidota bacterium]